MPVATIISAAGVALPAMAQIQNQRQSQSFLANQAAIIQDISRRRADLIERGGEQEFAAFMERANQIDLQASRETAVTKQQVLEIREQGRAAVAEVMAKNAARGVAVDSGSPLEAAAEQAGRAEKLAAIKEQRAGFRINNLLFEAEQQRTAGERTLFAARSTAFSTLLTGLAEAAGIQSQAPSDLDIFAGAAQAGGSIFNIIQRDRSRSALAA